MTVGLVIVSHSEKLAEGVAELAGQMTQGKVTIAPAGGAEEGVIGTAADKIISALQSANSPDGVLVLLDLGSAILSTEMALELLEGETHGPIQLSYAPIVEGAVAAALEASLGRSLSQVRQAAEHTAQPEQLRQMKPLSQEEEVSEQEAAPVPSAETPAPAAPAEQRQWTLHNPAGLHARPASLFVQTAARFQSDIRVTLRGKQAHAASIMEILSLGARQGETITVSASGPDSEEAFAALQQLVQANFYEAPAEEQEKIPTPGETTTQPAQPHIAQHQEGEPWQGISTSRGVALGPAFLYTAGHLTLGAVEKRTIKHEQVAAQQQRLRSALTNAARELDDLVQQVQRSVGQAEAGIFEAQALMLRDPALWQNAERLIEEELLDATTALARAGEQQATQLAHMDNDLMALRAVDMRDAVGRAIEHLGEYHPEKPDLSALKQPVILLAQDLTPSDTARLRPEVVLGICTTQGGITAHSAIIARALSIPAIAGLDTGALMTIHDGDELALDADQGLLYHHPAPEIRERLQQHLATQKAQRARQQTAAQQSHAPLRLFGRTIHLLANVGSEAEATAARQWGAEGIGLLRSEFLFGSATSLPSEEEQRRRFSQIFRAFSGDSTETKKPVVVRTLDAGADKPMPALEAVIGSMKEENPALGLRGLRIHLAYPELLEQQFSALLRAAAETNIELHIMFPMVSTVEELLATREIFQRVYQRLHTEITLPEHIPLGIMVEVPSASIMAEELADHADFFSIGANDLLQYTIASDRTNARVSSLYNSLQPALLRSIKQIAAAGQKKGIPVAVCGEIGGNPRLAPLLVALGVDELSMTPTSLPDVRTALSGTSEASLREVADRILHARSVSEVDALLETMKNFPGNRAGIIDI